MAVLGYNTVGGTSGVYLFGSGVLTRFTPTEDGDIDDLNAYINQAGGGWSGDQVGMAVINMSNNAVKCYSALRDTISDTAQWYTFTGLTEVETDGLKLFDGEEVGLAIWCNNPGDIRGFSDAGSTGQFSENTDDESFPTWNTWAETSSSDIQLSSFINYTASASGITVTFDTLTLTPTYNNITGTYLGNQIVSFDTLSLTQTFNNITGTASSGYGFSYTLAETLTTSAGVIDLSNNTLIRTLWSNTSETAATYNKSWDGDDDAGSPASGGPFKISVISNNITPVWEGVIGNTSSATEGSTVLRHLRGIQDFAITGTKAFFGIGFCESDGSSYRMDLTAPQAKYAIIPVQNGDIDLEVDHVCTDGTTVYWAGFDSFATGTSGVYGTLVSDYSEVEFSSGTSMAMIYGRTYNWGIDVTTGDATAHPSGIAVQTSGSYLFVAHEGQNQLRVLNKSTGAFVRNISVTTPRRIFIDSNDDLWMISGTATVAKYTINGDGTITSATLTLATQTEPQSLGVYTDASVVAVINGGSSQQVKAYDASTGSLVWTKGDSGGYLTNSNVSYDKFMFNHTSIYVPQSWIAFNSSDGFWLGDTGNYRSIEYDDAQDYVQHVQALRTSYQAYVNETDPTRLHSDYLEFSQTFGSTLGPLNGTWELSKNWGGGITDDYVYPSLLDERYTFRSVKTHNRGNGNGRTYALINFVDVDETRYPEVVELVDDGIVRFTGERLGAYVTATQLQNGDLIWGDWDRDTVTATGDWYIQERTGYSTNDPTYDTPVSLQAVPEVTSTNPSYKGTGSPAITDSNRMVVFAPAKENEGYHLGLVQIGGGATFMAQVSPSTTTGYTGDFPDDGTFDIGNSVEYAGGDAIAIGRNVYYNYIGEFYKNNQTNMYNMFNDRLIMLAQFGVVGADVASTESAEQMAGNAFSVSGVNVEGDDYIFTNDESWKAGVHRWKVSGLDTIQEQSTIVGSTYTLDVEPLDLTATYNNITGTLDASTSVTFDTLSLTQTFNDITGLYDPKAANTFDTLSLTQTFNNISGVLNTNITFDTLSITQTFNDCTLTFTGNQGTQFDTLTITPTFNDVTLTLYTPPVATNRRHRLFKFSFFGKRYH